MDSDISEKHTGDMFPGQLGHEDGSSIEGLAPTRQNTLRHNLQDHNVKLTHMQ